MAKDFSKAKGAGHLKEIQQKSTEQSNGLVAINIPLDQIDENPENAEIFNMDNIDSLADGIQENGFLGAINVLKKPDGRYEISSGHRRYRAMRALGRETIPCIVDPYPDDDVERVLKLISSNIRNRELHPMDWARVISRYIEAIKSRGFTGNVRNKAAEYFKMAPANINRYLCLLRLIPELQEIANDPDYAFSAFTSASTMDEADQKLLYDQMQEELEAIDKAKGTVKTLSRVRIEQMTSAIKDKYVDESQKNKSKGNFVTGAVETPSIHGDGVIIPETERPAMSDPEDVSDADFGEDDNLPETGEGMGSDDYYTEFRAGNPLKNGTLEKFDSGKLKSVIPDENDDDDNDEGEESAVAEETTKMPVADKLDRIVDDIESLGSPDYFPADRDVIKSRIERIERAIAELKQKYVI